MKAIVYQKYGLPENMKLKEVEKPVPGDDEVLVQVYAASVNSSDWEFLRGKPIYTRIWGLYKPKYTILGSDIAGKVEAVGRNVTQFQVGDEVFGDIFDHWGGFAEYVCVPVNKTMILKPEWLHYEEASAIPQAAVVALQGLRDKGQIQEGESVLINGAGGGAGTFAIQLAKLFGAEVTGVDNSKKLELMRSLGADHVIDYTKEDFTRNGKQYDLILDFVAFHSLFKTKKALSPGGRYVMVGGSVAQLFQTLFLGSLISMTTSRKIGILAHIQNKKDLAYITSLIETGKVSPIIEKRFSLDEVPEALMYLGEGNALGKVVVTIVKSN